MSQLAALRAALQVEREALIAEHQSYNALDLRARAGVGHTLYPLDIITVELRSRSRVNVLLRGSNLHTGINAGDLVTLAPLGRPDSGFDGRCDGVDGNTVELRLDVAPEGKGPWAVSRRLDLSLLDREADALERAERIRSPLAHLLRGIEPPYRPDPYEHSAFAALDASQQIAAALAFGATEIGLVHGPPGTGKTEVLAAILEACRERGERPWALAASNAAVDVLAEKTAARGLTVVRIGVSSRIGSRVLPLTLEHRILHGARSPVITGLLRDATRASSEELAQVRAAIAEEWSVAKREILDNADVLAMTLGTLYTRGDRFPPPRTAVVDEASQIWEPSIWLLASRVKRMILAGDPQQLGPVSRSKHPLLDRSLLERLVETGFSFPMLQTQYRMSDALLALSQGAWPLPIVSAAANAGVLVADLGVDPGFFGDPSARFIDTAGFGADEEADGSGSFYNPGELQLLRRVWSELQAGGLRAEQVGVITPYHAQLIRLRAAFPELEAGTVNSFQGREKEVILCSWVRSNPQGERGFVADPRRLVVSVTRARRLWLGVGDSATLGGCPAWRELLGRIERGGGYTSAWELGEEP